MTSSSSNPFRMPKNISEFARREDEERRRERRRQRTLKVHEKGLKPRESFHKIMDRYFKEIEEEQKDMVENRQMSDDDEAYSPEALDECGWDFYHRGSNREFLEMEREIRRLEFAIVEGREKIQSMKDVVAVNRKELAAAEYLVRDKAFDIHVSEQVRKTLLAMEKAKEGEEALLKIKKEILKTKKEAENLKMELAMYEETLKHNKMCKEFLWKLSPREWQKLQESRQQIAKKIKAKDKAAQDNLGTNREFGTVLPPIQQTSCHGPEKMPQGDKGIIGDLEFYEKPQIYFTDPSELQNIIAEMEEKTNNLFEELDSIERSKELYSQKAKELEREMELETVCFTEEADCLIKGIEKNKQKVKDIQAKIKFFNESEDGIPNKNAVLNQLHQKLKQVYSACMECLADNLSSFQILGQLETCMSDLLGQFENAPQESLKPIIRAYRREKIVRMKEEETRLKDLAVAEQRNRRAEVMLQRALADDKKRTGKKVMWRSQLEKKDPKIPKEDQKKAALSAKEREL